MMESNFVLMNEEYKKKHYPDGSVFSEILKMTKKGGIGIYFFFVPFMLVSAVGIVFSAKMLIEVIVAGENDMISVGVFALCLCVVFFLVTLLPIILTKKRSSLDVEGLMKKSAKYSACDESQIREFERQALASDSRILALTATYKAKLNGQRDGILTRDYIFLADNQNIVMKYSDIVGAFLVERIIHLTVDNKTKTIDSLTISLVSNKHVKTFVDASVEAGSELISILLEKNPQIETKGGNVIQEKEFDQYCKALK